MLDDVIEQIIDRANGLGRWRDLVSPLDHTQPDLAARVIAMRVFRRTFELSHGSMSVVPSLAAIVAVEARIDDRSIDGTSGEPSLRVFEDGFAAGEAEFLRRIGASRPVAVAPVSLGPCADSPDERGNTYLGPAEVEAHLDGRCSAGVCF